MKKKLIVYLTVLTLIPSLLQAEVGSKQKSGLSVRDSAFKDTVPRDSDYADNTKKTFADLYGDYTDQVNNGNLKNGEQDTKPSDSSSDSTSDGTTYFEDKNILKNAVDGKEAVNGKALKGTSDDINKLIAYAKSCLASETTGNYIWAGNTGQVKYVRGRNNDGEVHEENRSKGADCSGFVMDCYKHIGITLNARRASEYASITGVKVDYKNARAGDIIGISYGGGVAHTALYLGNGQYIESSGDEYECKDGVNIRTITTGANGQPKGGGGTLVSFKRVIAVTDAKDPTADNNQNSNGQNNQNNTGKASNAKEAKNKGTPQKPVITHLNGYPDGIGYMYSVGGKYTVGINAGHRGPGDYATSTGTSSIGSGTDEYVLTFQLASKLKDTLNSAGYNVVMTRTKHNVDFDNPERGEMFSLAGCDMAIGIHFDGSETGDHGFSYVMNSGKKGTNWQTTAKYFYDSLASEMLSKQNKIPKHADYYRSNYTGFDKCTTPYFYMELGFINSGTGKVEDTDCPYVESQEYWNIFCNAFLKTMKSKFK